MGILNDVLQYKAQKEAQEAQVANAIPQAVKSFLDSRQQQQKNMIDMLTIDASLAKSGLRRTKDGFVKDPSLMSPFEQLIEQGKAATARNAILEGGGADPLPQIGKGGGMIGGGGQLNVPQSGIPASQPSTQSEEGDMFATQATLNVAGQPTSTTVKSESGMRRELGIKGEEAKASTMGAESAKREAKKLGAMDLSEGNLRMVAGVARDLSQAVAESYQEGGALKDVGLFRKVGSEISEKLKTRDFPATRRVPGKVFELTAKIMPMLTQQGDDKGSVRLVESVFRGQKESLPAVGEHPITAIPKTAETIRTLTKFAIAVDQYGIKLPTDKEASDMGEDKYNSFVDRIKGLASSIELDDQQNKVVNEMIMASVQPLVDVLKPGDIVNLGGGQMFEVQPNDGE